MSSKAMTKCPCCGAPICEAEWRDGQIVCRDCASRYAHPDTPMIWPICPTCGAHLPTPVDVPSLCVKCTCGRRLAVTREGAGWTVGRPE